MKYIPPAEYSQIINVLPIICVDVVIQNQAGEYLLLKRVNEPMKGYWWVVGGRLQKGETLKQAAVRKVKEEAGLDVEGVVPIGYYEDIFDTNPFGVSTPLHTVSVVFYVQVGNDVMIRLDSQSDSWKYSKELPNEFRINPFAEVSFEDGKIHFRSGKANIAEIP